MRITLENNSRISTKVIRKLMRFVDGRVISRGRVVVILRDEPDPDQIGHGRAFYGRRPPVIEMWVSCGAFPWVNIYRKRIGSVTINSVEEEIVFLLAHEFRHLDQRYVKVKQVEVDAERFGVKILNEWRNRNVR